MSLSKEILEGTVEGVKSLLQQGAPVNVLDEYGYTPLIHATVTNRLDIVELLLRNGALPDLIDISGSTALHWAVDINNLDTVKILLRYGASANAYSSNGQPVLFYPYLRKNKEVVDLLVSKGADLIYAKDFAQSKLIGHRFELQGNTDIMTPAGLYLSMDLEGFYLEFTLDIIHESLGRFINSFVAHRMDIHPDELKKIMEAFDNASKLREFKHFTKDVNANKETIDKLIDKDLLLLPVSYRGHAITFVKHGNFLAKCDRGVAKMTDPIVVNSIGNLAPLTHEFYSTVLYKRQTDKFMKSDLYKILSLTPYMRLPIKHQITGNCSWANVEASVPTMLYMLLYDKLKDKAKADALVGEIMQFYRTWLDWDKDRALEDWITDFDKITFQRQKAKAALLGAVLFQSCLPNRPQDVARAKKILGILSRPSFQFIVRTYANVFVRGTRTSEGRAFQQLIEACGYKLSDFSH